MVHSNSLSQVSPQLIVFIILLRSCVAVATFSSLNTSKIITADSTLVLGSVCACKTHCVVTPNCAAVSAEDLNDGTFQCSMASSFVYPSNVATQANAVLYYTGNLPVSTTSTPPATTTTRSLTTTAAITTSPPMTHIFASSANTTDRTASGQISVCSHENNSVPAIITTPAEYNYFMGTIAPSLGSSFMTLNIFKNAAVASGWEWGDGQDYKASGVFLANVTVTSGDCTVISKIVIVFSSLCSSPVKVKVLCMTV